MLSVCGAAGLVLVGWALFADARWFEHHVYALYCTIDPGVRARELKARIWAGLLGLVLLGWVAPAAGRWGARRTGAQMIGSALTILVPVLMSLGVSELVLRRAARAKAPPALDPFLPPMHFDPDGWYVNVPSSSKEVIIQGAPVRYFFDSHGNRAPDAHTESDRSAPTILITGESIGLGYDLPYEKTCAALLAKALGVQVVNVSVTGFAPDQALRRLEEALAWFEHPIATVSFVVPLALPRAVRHGSTRLSLSSAGGLVSLPRRDTWLGRSVLWNVLERVIPLHSSEAVALTRAILQRTVQASQARGARPVFVMTNYGSPCIADARGTPPLSRELFEAVGGAHAIVDIASDECTGGGDMHPNEVGERKIEAAIESMLRSSP